MAEANITVEVEKAIHDGLIQYAQHMADEYGIQIHDVKFEWWDVSTASESRIVVSSVRIDSSSKQPDASKK